MTDKAQHKQQGPHAHSVPLPHIVPVWAVRGTRGRWCCNLSEAIPVGSRELSAPGEWHAAKRQQDLIGIRIDRSPSASRMCTHTYTRQPMNLETQKRINLCYTRLRTSVRVPKNSWEKVTHACTWLKSLLRVPPGGRFFKQWLKASRIRSQMTFNSPATYSN